MKCNFESDFNFLISLISFKEATSNSSIPLAIICLITFSFGFVFTAYSILPGKFSLKNFTDFLSHLAVCNIRDDPALIC